jgi:hypothetical protein
MFYDLGDPPLCIQRCHSAVHSTHQRHLHSIQAAAQARPYRLEDPTAHTNAHTPQPLPTLFPNLQPHIITASPCSQEPPIGSTGRTAHTQPPPPIPGVHPTLPQRWAQHPSAPPALKSNKAAAQARPCMLEDPTAHTDAHTHTTADPNPTPSPTAPHHRIITWLSGANDRFHRKSNPHSATSADPRCASNAATALGTTPISAICTQVKQSSSTGETVHKHACCKTPRYTHRPAHTSQPLSTPHHQRNITLFLAADASFCRKRSPHSATSADPRCASNAATALGTTPISATCTQVKQQHSETIQESCMLQDPTIHTNPHTHHSHSQPHIIVAS